MTLVTAGKADFIQYRYDRYRDHLDRILQWGERLDSIQHGQVKLDSQGAGVGSVDGKLLRKNLRG